MLFIPQISTYEILYEHGKIRPSIVLHDFDDLPSILHLVGNGIRKIELDFTLTSPLIPCVFTI